MPILSSSNYKILVTGASGYTAAWVVRALLEKGYAVRGTVRSESKGQALSKIFAEFGERFEYIVVEDIAKEGAFDEAVKGVDAIEHTASPFHFKADDPQELIKPAVQGTVGILESTLKFGSSVKRVIITSSAASVLTILPDPKVFSEKDWNEQAVEIVNESGKDAPAVMKYRASKILAERAAWNFVKINKEKISWDLVIFNPVFIFGPFIHDVPSIPSLGTSALDWYYTVATESMNGRSLETLANTGSCWIDVRDVGEAHALALEKEEAAGERIILSAGPFVWQDWLDAANSLTPSPIPSHKLPKGSPGAGKNAVHMINYDTAKADRILGIKYRTMEECTRDTLADFESRGW